MASITTRAGKGTPLTNAEVDANFTNLNAELLTKQDALGFTPANKAGDTFTGNIGVGASAVASARVVVGTLTGGADAAGYSVSGSVQSDATSSARGFNTFIGTQATSFTLPILYHYRANQTTFGAGSTVGSQIGFHVEGTLTGATNNYAFRGQIGSGSGRWNLYMDGTASNYLAGATIFNNAIGLGSASSPSYGTAGQVLTSAGAGAAPTWTTLTGALTFTGDVTGTGSTGSSTSLTLANSGVTAGVYGGNNAIPSITFDAKGRATSAGTVTPSGTWGISITGNAATAATLQTARTINGVSFDGSANITITADPNSHTHSIDTITDEHRLFNNMGANHSSYTDFNTSRTSGVNYMQGGTNGPTGTASHQFYGFKLGLGNDYDPASQYASQLYWARQAQGGGGYLWARDMEGGSWGSWRKMSAGYADSAGSANSVAWTNVSGRPTAVSSFTNDSGYITSSSSISGSAGSVSGLTLTSSANGINPDSVTQNQIGYNTSVSLFGQTDGGLYSSAYSSSWIHQIYGDFRTGQIAIRGKNSGTWQAWRTVLDSSNYTSYAVRQDYNTSLNSDTRNTRGVTRLYRRDDNSDYSVQTYWTGSYWRLYGYNGDTGHADTHVGYADSAGSASSASTSSQVTINYNNDSNSTYQMLWGRATPFTAPAASTATHPLTTCTPGRSTAATGSAPPETQVGTTNPTLVAGT